MSSYLKSWRIATILVTILLVLLTAHSALAAPSSASSTRNSDQQLKQAETQAVSEIECGSIEAVKVLRQADDHTISSITPSTVPGMVTKVSVPRGKQECLLMRFSAETECTTPSGTFGWCIVSILVDGVEASPGAGSDFAFDSTYNGTAVTDTWQSNSMDRSIVVGPGSHTIEVQWSTTDPNITIWLGEMSLTIEQADSAE